MFVTVVPKDQPRMGPPVGYESLMSSWELSMVSLWEHGEPVQHPAVRLWLHSMTGLARLELYTVLCVGLSLLQNSPGHVCHGAPPPHTHTSLRTLPTTHLHLCVMQASCSNKKVGLGLVVFKCSMFPCTAVTCRQDTTPSAHIEGGHHT